MTRIAIQFSHFSAFYSPLIATDDAGLLKEEGLEGEFSVPPLGISAIEAFLAGEVQVIPYGANSGPNDPLFVDPDRYDFRLKPDSPALAMGFVSIDLTSLGPR